MYWVGAAPPAKISRLYVRAVVILPRIGRFPKARLGAALLVDTKGLNGLVDVDLSGQRSVVMQSKAQSVAEYLYDIPQERRADM